MEQQLEQAVLAAFRRTAQRVPAYACLLAEAGVEPSDIQSLEAFCRSAPVLDKEGTFGRFGIAELCVDGTVGSPAAVLTSSGHSGRFAFGIYSGQTAGEAFEQTDAALDAIFAIRTRPTLLINCLPMGVKVHTQACTLAEVSVRADMATALVREFGGHFAQVILVGEAAFLKHVLELGIEQGVQWNRLLVHLIVGEEPLAENARTYLMGLLGCDAVSPDSGIIGSSMGVAELGMNLFLETPQLIALRRMLHLDASLRLAVLGPGAATAPMIFTYDPRRIFVEVLDDQLVLTTLDDRPLPLIRYRTGDLAMVPGPETLAAVASGLGLPAEAVSQVPVVLMQGRAKWAWAGERPVFPEEVKEGLYATPELARATTGNFRLTSGSPCAKVRIQLAPGVEASAEMDRAFQAGIEQRLSCPLEVCCEPYERFGDGMALDYERKFPYLRSDVTAHGAVPAGHTAAR